MRLLTAFILLLLPAPALALSGDWSKDEAVAVRLISGVDGIGNAATVPLGLDVTLADGWHTYWRSPGMAGLPPQLDWTASATDAGNVQSAELLYPAPQRYDAFGLETVGYRDHVLFPIDVKLRKAGEALDAAASVDLLVCSNVCVPKHFDLSLKIPAGAAQPSAEAPLLQQARDHVPAPSDALKLENAATDGKNATFTITSREALTQPDLFIEDDKDIGFGAPQIIVSSDGHRAVLTVNPVEPPSADNALDGLRLTVTITDGDRSSEIKTTLSQGSSPATAPPVASTPAAQPSAGPLTAPRPPLSIALFFALLGGLILNLMPCVLPVLSLKILSVISHGGGAKRFVRQSFLITASGIVFSFMALAAATIALKHFGLALGWGVQFQQPAFLMLLTLLLTLFAANLWGLFEIPLPRFLADGVTKAHHPKLAGDFATGAFATLLATPCSAPFLGTAVGFALAGSACDILAIFAALGCGMALPYLAVAIFPGMATRLPKPGAWMLTLRKALGVALALTAAWLAWVLAAQITALYAALFGVLMIGIVLLMILKKRGKRRGLIAITLAELCVIALALGLYSVSTTKSAPEMDHAWVAFDQKTIDADIAAGKTVFLDVTADWCLTCKANMKFTLSRDEVKHRLFGSDVIAMQANWTSPNPVITDLLHKYGRYGIPFNVVYGPGAPQGIVLPELLTPTLVLQALDKASHP